MPEYIPYTIQPDAVPHEGKYGIYVMYISKGKMRLLYTTDNEIYTSALRLNKQGEKPVLLKKRTMEMTKAWKF